MKRRNFLKAICASPLALLAKKPKRRSGTRKLTDEEVAKAYWDIVESRSPEQWREVTTTKGAPTWTTGTSSNTAVWTYQQDYPLGTCKVDSSGQRWIYCKIS
jgi:hypothetical protein